MFLVRVFNLGDQKIHEDDTFESFSEARKIAETWGTNGVWTEDEWKVTFWPAHSISRVEIRDVNNIPLENWVIAGSTVDPGLAKDIVRQFMPEEGPKASEQFSSAIQEWLADHDK